MHFTKMHGLGNDYLYYYGELEHPEELSIRLSDRHFGIGSDGIITISPSSIADFKMRIFNADGSEAKMCGNGIRSLRLITLGTKVNAVMVDMGKSDVREPVTLSLGEDKITCTPVSMGNPHAVIFVKDAENAPLTSIGAKLEKHVFFPEGVNVEFVEQIERNVLRMRVWERGSGITMACGTGACAAVAAAVAAGICPLEEEVSVLLDGGKLQILVHTDRTVIMTGTADTVCECEV